MPGRPWWALSVMSAETYWLQINGPVYVGGTELKTGDYRSKVKPLQQKAESTTLVCEKAQRLAVLLPEDTFADLAIRYGSNSRTHRNPTPSPRRVGRRLPRTATPISHEPRFQEPPRTTRRSPSAGPFGSTGGLFP